MKSLHYEITKRLADYTFRKWTTARHGKGREFWRQAYLTTAQWQHRAALRLIK